MIQINYVRGCSAASLLQHEQICSAAKVLINYVM